MGIQRVTADARDIPIPDGSIDLALWSPPYYAMRMYGDSASEIGKPGAVEGYIAELVAAVDESMWKIRPGGSLFVNVQDRYVNRSRVRASAHQPGMHSGRKEFAKKWKDAAAAGEVLTPNIAGLRERSLALIPERFALAVYEAGYWIKAHNIWSKPFGIPDPAARDRTVIRHESVLHISHGPDVDSYFEPGSRHSVVTFNPSSGEEGHPAPWPEELCEWIIEGWSKPGDSVLDAFGGSGVTARVADRMGREATTVDIYKWEDA